MAAALLRHALSAEPEPLKSIPVISAGVSAMAGYPAAANAIQALKKVGIELNGHRSQRVTQELLNEALAVFCMTESHRVMIELDFDPIPSNLHLMRDPMGHGDSEIPDPFGRNLAGYEASRDSMVEAIPSLIAYLRTLVLPPPADSESGEA
jgi:protein-tyrosine phosphatase